MNSPFKTKYKQLQNGLKIYTTQYKGIQSVYLHAWVFVGSAYETEKNNGISHFLEHMMFRGNEKLGDGFQFNYLMEELGGELNAA
ncbi:MAG: insulinase family protein, partial [Deltaproteobacteria bacterium]|nr:insulinase family protein [Deltaproteobacteria bacterium]